MSMTRSIARNIAHENMKRLGYAHVNKKHAMTSERKGFRFSKAFVFTTESVFSKNWRKFANRGATAYSLAKQAQAATKRVKRPKDTLGKKLTRAYGRLTGY